MYKIRIFLDVTFIQRTIGLSIGWTMLFICCYLSSGCALRPIPRDLATYVNRDIFGIVELENTALVQYDRQTGNNYISDDALRASLEAEIIPVYRRFRDLVSDIKPDTAPVRMLHATYRKAAALRLQGFRSILLAIDTQDPDLLRQANRMLDKGQILVKQWQDNVSTMARQYNLALK